MLHRSSNLVERVTAAVLTGCVSLCCCQAELLLAGLSAHGTSPVCRLAASAPPHCANCPNDGPGGQDAAPPGPVRGCQLCWCVKGFGPKDAGAAPRNLSLAITPVLSLPAGTVPSLPYHADGPHRAQVKHVRVQPPTLLRLHCALIV